MNKHAIILPALILNIILMISCVNDPGDENGPLINPNIIKIKDCCSEPTVFYGDILAGNMINDRIYYLFGYLQVDESFNVLKDSVFNPDTYVHQFRGTAIRYRSGITISGRFLFVASNYIDVSIGRLYEYDLTSNVISMLKDSVYNISSAVYWHGNDTKLVYYSYGNEQGLEAGYYLFDITTGEDSLLYAHRSPIGELEMLNGFDLSPDNSKLLIPDVRASRFEFRTPRIIEYDLHTHQTNTIDVTFDLSLGRIGLWLRYSPDGKRILYCNFPFGSLGDTTNDSSEVGIIDVSTRQKRILDVNTNPVGTRWSVQVAPTWTPDGQHIIFGSTPVATHPHGVIGAYSLYVLKNVDDPINYK